MSDTWREPGCGDAAAYALGALGEREAEMFRGHAEGCVACRDELASFERLADVLPMAVPQYEVPRTLRHKVMRDVRADVRARATPRRRHAWRLGALPRPAIVLAAVIVIALAVLAGAQIGGGTGGVRTYRASLGDAQLRVAGGRGELIVGRLPLPGPGRIYELWLQRGSAAPTPTRALFSVTSTGTADVGVPGTMRGVSRVLVTDEPAGGSTTPTSPPVIIARLS